MPPTPTDEESPPASNQQLIADTFEQIPLIRDAINYRKDLSAFQSRKQYEAEVLPQMSQDERYAYMNQLLAYHQRK